MCQASQHGFGGKSPILCDERIWQKQPSETASYNGTLEGKNAFTLIVSNKMKPKKVGKYPCANQPIRFYNLKKFSYWSESRDVVDSV